jgi:hypothetical protein
MLVNKSQKSLNVFECKQCNYNTSSKKDFNKHTDTLKHKRVVNASNASGINFPIEGTIYNNNIFTCCCGKSYCHDSSYYRHKKKCSIISSKEDLITCINDSTKQQQLIDYLLKENSEFKQLMLDQNKQMIDI